MNVEDGGFHMVPAYTLVWLLLSVSLMTKFSSWVKTYNCDLAVHTLSSNVTLSWCQESRTCRALGQEPWGRGCDDHGHQALEEEDVADVCDGDIQLLDEAVKRFKTTIWENQFET